MTPRFSKPLHRLPSSLLAFSAMLCSVNAHASKELDLSQQRKVYDQAQQLLDDRNIEQYLSIRPQIAHYPLTPYVDYRVFMAQLGDKSPQEVTAFIEQNSSFPFSNRIRAPYLDRLAQQKEWQALLRFQTDPPRGEQYQCHYYNALLQTGNKQAAYKGAEHLWLHGKSVSDACDPLFQEWDKAGLRTDQLILERMLLAFDARNGKLLNYLAKQLDSTSARNKAKQMVALFNQPEKVTQFAIKQPAKDFYQQQAEMALEKLARKDVTKAQQAWSTVVERQHLPDERAQQLADYISFRLINTDSPSLIQWRDSKIATTSNVKLLERRSRLAIQHADWQGVTQWIALMPEEAQQSNRWQYWQGRSEVALGQTSEGQKRLESILGQRNFYSVAAAKEIQRSIEYPQTTFTLDRNVVAPYSVSLTRIDELIVRDKIAAAKSEWRWLLRRADSKQKEMLAAYAAYKRWHHLTVTASIQAKMWDNIELRFPVAHSWWFNFYGEKHNIDPITLMSLARQESAMDVEARSPVGARGIMQIMPSTAKYTAKKYQLSYRGSHELYEVGKNIEIGSHYLQGLLEQYDNNRIFAFAAYNAGPARVKTWRSRTQGKLDAYAFIEAIPFNETRGYVQNILMFETYYRDLLGADGAFLNPHEVNTQY